MDVANGEWDLDLAAQVGVAASALPPLLDAAATVATAGRLIGIDVEVVHLVGGGSLNRLLCQATADRSGLAVLAGPVEATALGNVLVQARTHGWLGPDATLETMRALVAEAFPPERYEPHA